MQSRLNDDYARPSGVEQFGYPAATAVLLVLSVPAAAWAV